MNRKIGSTLIALALGVSASSVLACEEHARAAEAKDAKAVAVKVDAKDGDMPCCAHAKAAGDKKIAAAGEKPCAAHDAKGCPKKTAVTAAVVAKADPGTHR